MYTLLYSSKATEKYGFREKIITSQTEKIPSYESLECPLEKIRSLFVLIRLTL